MKLFDHFWFASIIFLCGFATNGLWERQEGWGLIVCAICIPLIVICNCVTLYLRNTQDSVAKRLDARKGWSP